MATLVCELGMQKDVFGAGGHLLHDALNTNTKMQSFQAAKSF